MNYSSLFNWIVVQFPNRNGGATGMALRACDCSLKQNVCWAMLAFFCLSGFSTVACADVPPRSYAQLNEAETIVIGTIKQIRVESERSLVEKAFGNNDWGIYVTLSIEKVEKGILESAEIEVRCFRLKSRRSAMESLSVTGHRPIPRVGTRVRVYFEDADRFEPILPNGITLSTANDDSSVALGYELVEAKEVSQLSSLAFTFLLPLELWGVLLIVVLIAYGLVRFLRSRSLDSSSWENG